MSSRQISSLVQFEQDVWPPLSWVLVDWSKGIEGVERMARPMSLVTLFPKSTNVGGETEDTKTGVS